MTAAVAIRAACAQADLPPGIDWSARLAISPPGDPLEVLGRKGLLGKDNATRMALCAVHEALGLPRGERPDSALDPRTAVVVSSNLGNVETVVSVARDVHQGRLREVSPLDAPNASSNVVASAVAIWFRLGGPNVTVCSGWTSGLDALAIGVRLLRAGRATRVVVAGVEPGDEASSEVFMLGGGGEAPLFPAAAAVVLELVATDDDPATHAPTIVLGAPTHAVDVELVAGDGQRAARAQRSIDLTRDVGSTYGALGVLQVALAARLLHREPRWSSIGICCGARPDGYRSAVVGRGAERGRST